MTTREDRVAAWTRASVRHLKPYYKAPLAGDPLRLDQNTNLLGPNPAIELVDPTDLDFSLYPTRDGDALLDALAANHGRGLEADHFTLGNGSDEALDILVKAFAEPGDKLAVTPPSYSLYPFYAALQDLKLAEVPLRGGFRLNVDGLAAQQPKITLLATPNNPTGNRFPAGDLEAALEALDGIVVIDEAYIEYAGEKHSFVPHVESYDNLIVMRTFSKAYALAGLRIGYLVANKQLSARLRVVKPPFNLNAYGEAVAVEALRQRAWLDDTVRVVVDERERLAGKLAALGFRVHPSDANFLLTEGPLDPGHLHAELLARGILARTFPGKATLERAIRFTVGGPQHTDALVAALAQILEDA